MEGLFIRAIATDLEIASGDGRTVFGKLAPYGELAEVDDGFGPYIETFDAGCFRGITRAGHARFLRVHLEHDGRWIGRGDMWDDRLDGLYATMKLDATEAGREAAWKIRDGQTPGLSLAFSGPSGPTEQLPDGRTVVHRRRVRNIHHVALCAVPAYASAQVESLRSRDVQPSRVDYWKSWTERVAR